MGPSQGPAWAQSKISLICRARDQISGKGLGLRLALDQCQGLEATTGHRVHKNSISADFKLTFLKEAFDSEFFLKIEPFGPLFFVEDFEVAKVKIFTEEIRGNLNF